MVSETGHASRYLSAHHRSMPARRTARAKAAGSSIGQGGPHLVLELVTLALEVQRMVQVLVDLLRLAVLLQHAAQHTHPPQPQLLHGHAGLLATLPLAMTSVAALQTRIQGVMAGAPIGTVRMER